MDNFSKLPTAEKKPYFEKAADEAGLPEHIVEKDFWVCWTLKRLFTHPTLSDHIIFKGGTSLSKVFHVIERFSEDIDISISKEFLGFGGDKDPEKSGGSKKVKSSIESLALACKAFVQNGLKTELKSSFENFLGSGKDWSLEVDAIDNDGQTLLFSYPTATKNPGRYVAPTVKIEFGSRSDHWPAHQHEIISFLAEHIPELTEAPTSVKTLDAARTFWEKATILHAYAHYPAEKIPAERQSRHYYDFYKLLHSKHKTEAMNDLQLLARVAEHKSVYFRAGWANYEEAKKGTLKLIPAERVEEIMKRDFVQMNEMFFKSPPSWQEILSEIQKFESEFNK